MAARIVFFQTCGRFSEGCGQGDGRIPAIDFACMDVLQIAYRSNPRIKQSGGRYKSKTGRKITMARQKKVTKSEAVVKISNPRTALSASSSKVPASKSNANKSHETNQVDFSSSISIQEKVALLAYSYWERRGRRDGTPDEDWYRAEKEVLSRISVTEQ